MSDFLVELVDYMATNGLGTVATTSNSGDLFNEELPADPDNCVCVFGQPGAIMGDQRQITALTFPRFQVLVRNKSYPTGSDKLTAIRAVLHGLNGVSLPSWKIMRCYAEQEGGPIGSDDQNRFEFSINFAAEIYAGP